MKKKEFLALLAAYYDEMGIDGDTALQHDFDEETQTLRIHVLSEEELETLAGHCADRCEDCLWVESCENAHGDPDCTEFVAREGNS